MDKKAPMSAWLKEDTQKNRFESLPKQLALIKEMNSFTYGGVSNNFYLMVSTLKYKRTQPQWI
jgi:hypothetical protein